MEVMGLMLGEFVDDYTVRVIDVFAMPQSGTGVSVEAVDPVFQAKMLDMLKQTGRPEMVVGWYHSHPGFGCWLSGVDINTQQSFEALSERAVAVVVDPIQSVKGKVVIGKFSHLCISVVMNCKFKTSQLTKIYIYFSLNSRRFSVNQSQHDGIGTRAQTNHFSFGPFTKTIDPSSNSWFKPTLLFHCY